MKVTRCPGINLDNLASYFTGLGILSAIDRCSSLPKPDVRGCWRDDSFVLVHPDDFDLRDFLLKKYSLPNYSIWWKSSKDDMLSARNVASDTEVAILDSHIAVVSRSKKSYNPIFGTGGNFGRRKFASNWTSSRKGPSSVKHEISGPKRDDYLDFTLFGIPTELPTINGLGSWNQLASKRYTSTIKGAERCEEGAVSPWTYALAVEGGMLNTGSIGKRYGTYIRYSRFPFITTTKTVNSKGDASTDNDYWAPVWSEPASLFEVQSLLTRGLAWTGKRYVEKGTDMAVAILNLGVDAGIDEFIRFGFRQTTSTNTKESMPFQRIPVPERHDDSGLILSKLNRVLHRIVADKPASMKTALYCLEESLIDTASTPEDTDRWQKVLLRYYGVRKIIDRNKDLRKKFKNVRFELPIGFVDKMGSLSPEQRIAWAIASMGIREFVFGDERVWHDTDGKRALMTLLKRRTLDKRNQGALYGKTQCSLQDMSLLVNGLLDIEEIARWVGPFSLIKPYTINTKSDMVLDGNTAFATYLKPLFQPLDNEPFQKEDAMVVIEALWSGNWERAVFVAERRYLSHNIPTVRPIAPPDNCETVLLSMLVPWKPDELERAFRRWLTPEKLRR